MDKTLDDYPLLIRADAGGMLGTGHVMRMIALAQAWQERGGSVTLASCQCPASLIERLAKENIQHVTLGSHSLGDEAELEATKELAQSIGAKWIVIDGYHFSSTYQKALKDRGFKVLAMDDYGHCETWHADIVLNQNLRDKDEEADAGATTPTRFLHGPSFSLLRREFRHAPRLHTRSPETVATKLLITFGGVDPTQASLKVLRALNSVPALALNLRILAGLANSNLNALAEEVAISPHEAELVPACDNMPTLYQWADRVISAGGSSCYEWMLFRIPGWIASVADNQDAIVKAMLKHGRAAGITQLSAISHQELARNLALWLGSKSVTSENVPLVDGYGALRLASALSSISSWVRPVDEAKDAGFLFALANDPGIRSAGRHVSAIQWGEHLAWLQRHCGSLDSNLMIIELLGFGPVGQVRFHQRRNQIWEIGISIASDQRQTGLGFISLYLAMCAHRSINPVRLWLAEIREENIASQRLFGKLGFIRADSASGMQTWHLGTDHSNSNDT